MAKNADPVRMCAACRQKKPKSELLRIVIADGAMQYDPTGHQDGRGIYVCRSESCVMRLGKMKKVAGRGRVPDKVLEQLTQEGNLE